MIGTLTRREWIIALLVALLATGVMQVPYLLGYGMARPGTQFTGIVINVEDFSYQEIMLEGYDGAWQFHIQYTSEEHSPAFLYVPYLALGHLARLLGLSVVDMWHLSRVFASLLLILATFGFIAALLNDRLQRWVAFLLAIFGGGFDWALFPWEKFDIVGGAPVDFRMAEAHLFFSALTFPHFALGVVLILAAFFSCLRAFERRDWRYALVTGITNALLVLTYPFLIFLVGCVLGIYWLLLSLRSRRILWSQFFLLVIAFGVPAPLVAYYAYVLQVNPVYREWNAQVATLSPNPLHYVLAYGVMLVLGIIGLRFRPVAGAMANSKADLSSARSSRSGSRPASAAGSGEDLATCKARGADLSPGPSPARRGEQLLPFPFREGRRSSERSGGEGRGVRSVSAVSDVSNGHEPVGEPIDLLWIWIAVVLVLLYVPLNMQRRFVEGLQVPLAIVATIGLVQVVLPWAARQRVFGRIARWRRYTLDGLARLTIVLFLLLMSASNLVVLTQLSLMTAIVQPEAFFRSLAEIRAVDWLRHNAAKSDVTLAEYWTAGLIPARAGTAVFAGQRYETIGFADKLGKVTEFYGNGVSDAWRCELLAEYHVKYVWWGPRERRLGSFDLGNVPYLEKAYSDSDVSLYRYTASQ